MGELFKPKFQHLTPSFAITAQRCRWRGLWLPLEEVRSASASLCSNLVRWHPEVEDYPIQFLGSSISIKYRGHYIVLATRHQLINLGIEECDVEHIGQLIYDDGKLITSAGFFRYGTIEQYADDDRFDIVALFFDKPAAEFPNLAARYFSLSEPWEVDPEAIIKCFLVGYPFADQSIDFVDERHLRLRVRNHECQYIGPGHAKGLHTVRDMTAASFSPDGMSGGAVMYIRDSPFGPTVELGGMVQRGGSSLFHYVCATQLTLYLDAAIRQHFNNTP